MDAIRVHAFGGIDAMIFEKIDRPLPGPRQVLVKVEACGVGPWDTWVRAGKSVVPQPLPLTLGSDIAGTIQALGQRVTDFSVGDMIYGVTNPRFTGAYAEYAVADVGMIAHWPKGLSAQQAASVPVITCTAQQMLFEHAKVKAGHKVLVLGGAGNVGAYAIQLASLAGADVYATGRGVRLDQIATLGAKAIDSDLAVPADMTGAIDVVVDTIGGRALEIAYGWLKAGGILITAADPQPDQAEAAKHQVKASFMLVSVNTADLSHLGSLFAEGKLRTNVAKTLPLSEAHKAHEMIESGNAPNGKLVLVPAGSVRN